MNESITFPERYIKEVVSLIRRGLKTEKNEEIKEQLEKQCKQLGEYDKEMKKELTEDDWKIVEERLKTMPDDLKIGILSEKEVKKEDEC